EASTSQWNLFQLFHPMGGVAAIVMPEGTNHVSPGSAMPSPPAPPAPDALELLPHPDALELSPDPDVPEEVEASWPPAPGLARGPFPSFPEPSDSLFVHAAANSSASAAGKGRRDPRIEQSDAAITAYLQC